MPEADEVPDWLAALQAEEPEEIEAAETPVEAELPEAEPAEEIPSWLAALQPEGEAEEEMEAIDTAAKAEIEPQAIEEETEEAESLPEKEAVPAWLAGWQKEEEAEPEIETVEAEIIEEKATEPKAIPEKEVEEQEPASFLVSSYLSRLKSHPQDHQVRLSLARAYRDEKKLFKAFEQFQELVSSARQTKELIPDLEGLCSSHPDDAKWHLLLGDAYMRVDRLDDALNAYQEAQKIISRQ